MWPTSVVCDERWVKGNEQTTFQVCVECDTIRHADYALARRLSAEDQAQLRVRFGVDTKHPVDVRTYGITPLCLSCACKLADPITALHFPRYVEMPFDYALLVKLSGIFVTHEEVKALFPDRKTGANGCSLDMCNGLLGCPLMRYQDVYWEGRGTHPSYFVCGDCAARFRRTVRRIAQDTKLPPYTDKLSIDTQACHTPCRTCHLPISYAYAWYQHGKDGPTWMNVLPFGVTTDMDCERCIAQTRPLVDMLGAILYDALPGMPRVLATMIAQYTIIA
jgi:hypothetical protein